MFRDFKPVLKILLRFVLLYVALVLAYQLYLNGYKNSGLDPVSTWVAEQTNFLQNLFGYPSKLVPGRPEQETTWFFVSGKYVSRMVEGCNAISVMILFLAFIFAFFKGFKTFCFCRIRNCFSTRYQCFKNCGTECIIGRNAAIFKNWSRLFISRNYLRKRRCFVVGLD